MRQSFLDFLLSDDPSLQNPARVHALLQASYWAAERPLAVVEASMARSLCFGAYDAAGAQVGFARVVSDFATMYYLADVVVDARCRGQGLGTALVRFACGHPSLAGLRGMLITRDAHGLYEKFGFARQDGVFMRQP